MSDLNVGDHVWFDHQAVTVVGQRDGRVFYVHGHLDYLEEEAEYFRRLGSGW